MDELEALSISRSVIAELLDKAWEIGGYTVGEEEFNNYDWVKDGRDHLKDLDALISKKLLKQ
jgi:hypothetical protein